MYTKYLEGTIYGVTILNFVKMNPCGNTTVFILDPVPKKQYPKVADAIMSSKSVGAEQVGFISKSLTSPSGFRMEMMGEEFCGNASRSFAAWLFLNSNAASSCFCSMDNHSILKLDVSGYKGLLQAEVTPPYLQTSCYVSCEMPLPLSIQHKSNAYFGQYSFVECEGISHLIVRDLVPRQSDIEKAQQLAKDLGLAHRAIGIMYYSSATNSIRPLVHVDSVGTTIWETSCGSGSCAVAAAMADISDCRIGEYKICQPGGTLNIHIQRKNNQVISLQLGGIVELTASGTVYIESEVD